MTKWAVALLAALTVAIGGMLLLFFDGADDAQRIIRGSATALDGDTLEVFTSDGGDRYIVRIDALHAPELHEAGGAAARDWMKKRLQGRKVECRLESQPDQFGRTIGRCTIDGKDVGAELVAAGLGRACVKYGRHYLEFETPKSQQLRVPDYCFPEQ